MGKEIIKVAPDVDLYMEWYSVVEAPTAVGARAEMLRYLKPAHDCPACQCNPAAERLDRADRTGTSGLDGWGHDWDSSGLIYEQRGFLPRVRFAEFARRFLAEDEQGMIALLDPFEDDAEVAATVGDTDRDR